MKRYPTIPCAVFLLFLLTPLPTGAEEGYASWYGGKFQGRQTASGEIFDTNKLTAAHKALPFNTHVKVTNLENGKSVVVRINDRGPFIEGRIIDLSRAGAKAIAMTGAGIARVRLDIVKTADAAETAPDTSRNLLCSIQVGAFSSRENALRLKSLLESNGLNPEFEFTDVGIIRVMLYNIPTPDLGKTTSSLRKLGISQVLIRYSN